MTAIPGRFRKLPLEVTAICWTGGNWPEVEAFVQSQPDGDVYGNGIFVHLWIAKSDTWTVVPAGDWVIAEVDGIGFYRCTSAEFDRTYEAVEDDDVLTEDDDE